ncbi:MAG: hypothetical protein LBT50_09630, partial [Prevotellaceae bacterium]|nr:hypothetical protein [Prevotellaceae bacterium]
MFALLGDLSASLVATMVLLTIWVIKLTRIDRYNENYAQLNKTPSLDGIQCPFLFLTVELAALETAFDSGLSDIFDRHIRFKKANDIWWLGKNNL